MAHQSRDYMQYLDGRYGFSPANSQEEMNAAQVISDALREHDLNTQVEEFSAPLWGKRLYFIPMLLLFVGVFLVIFPGPARIVGLLIALVSTGFLVAGRLGYDVLSGLGPKAASQNVIAVHRAVGLAEGERPGRPVVVVAHYDSGREDLLSRRGLSSWRSRLVRITLYSVPVTMVLTLILMIPAIPFLARLLLWIVALIASAPTLLWGINNLTLLFGSYAEGSVDNKSGVAAMLSVADKVVYGESYHPRKEAMENGTLEALQRRQQQSRAEAERAAYEQEGQYYEGQPTEGVQYADEAYDAGGQPVQEEPYEAPAPDDQPYQPQFSGETVSMPAPYDDYVDDQPQYDNEPAAEPARDERDAIDLPDEQAQDAAVTDEPAESVPSDQEPAVEPLRDERDDEPEVVEPVEQQPSEHKRHRALPHMQVLERDGRQARSHQRPDEKKHENAHPRALQELGEARRRALRVEREREYRGGEHHPAPARGGHAGEVVAPPRRGLLLEHGVEAREPEAVAHRVEE